MRTFFLVATLTIFSTGCSVLESMTCGITNNTPEDMAACKLEPLTKSD